MTVPQMMRFVLAFGVATVVVQFIGLDTIGGLMALVHLCGFIGAPLAMILHRQLRSRPLVVAMSIALSFSLSALAVQSLIWFSLADRLLLIAVGTIYGVGLAALLAADGRPTEGLDRR